MNTGRVKAGCIYRIALVNFVTYKEVELFPGPSLNLIIGPNGTGKSTFVCAIILGLCGKTTVIGRSKKISDYVRSGCTQATIEIELYQKPGERNIIIKRIFNVEGLSHWYINGTTVKEKQVQEVIAKMKIQVDNLCQLLPQDRVQDFSKMNPQELLRSTLSAVGGQESVEQLDQLIHCRNENRNLSTKVTSNAHILQEQVRLNERLQVLIDAMQERKEIEKQIDICEKKKLWIEYQELRSEVISYAKKRKESEKSVENHKKKSAPLERVLEGAKNGTKKLEQEKLMINREVLSLKDKVKETLQSIKVQSYKIKDVETAFQEKLESHRNREQEIQEAQAKLEKLLMDKDRLVEAVGDDDRVKMELTELQKPITKTNAAIETLKKQKLQIQYDLDNNVIPQIKLYQNRIRSLEDVGQKRLDILRNYSEDCYQAVLWLRQNKAMFQHPVHEPMVLEINFSDPKFARYLESTIASRDLVAFTFESTRDMNLFLKNVRGEMGLKRVNAICSQPSNAAYNPPCDIEDLSYLGFYAYLVDTISAPDAITRYLCKQYSIHRIPIGNDHTYNNSGKVPSNINYFFTANHRFTVRVSAYSGAKSSSTIEIRPAKLLANTVDVEKLNTYNKQLSKFEMSMQMHREKVQLFETKLTALEDGLNELCARRKAINEGVDKVKTIFSQIRLQNKKLNDIRNEPVLSIEEEKTICRDKQKEAARKQCHLHKELVDIMKTLLQKCLYNDLWKIKLQLSRDAILKQESKLRELENEWRRIKAGFDDVERLLTSAKSKAKEKLLQAKAGCNNLLPQDPDFPYKDTFDSIPEDIDSLMEHCSELQTRMECMDAGDEQIIKEYEDREKLISKLKTEVNVSNTYNQQLEDKMIELRSAWLPPLESLLNDINWRFSDMFEKLGCAGEVKLEKTGNDDDYDKYGIAILVKFRESEQLQQLTRHTQSGGERALSTALYLMSLQRLTTVPFRCVDEINQGMDPINERKMFQLLVTVTTECDSQYFLLSPKLLTNLEYNDKIMIHTIMNGTGIMDHHRWQYSQFLQKARTYVTA